MSFYRKVVGIALIVTFAGSGSALAVGYERYDAATVSQTQPKNGTQTMTYQQDKSSFLKKCPAMLDEVAFFVRDVLSQFGLTNSKKP